MVIEKKRAGRHPVPEEELIPISLAVMAGWTNPEIRANLGLTERKLDVRLARLYKKYGITDGSRARLAVLICREFLAKKIPFPEMESFSRGVRKGKDGKWGSLITVQEDVLDVVAARIVAGEGDEEISRQTGISESQVGYRTRVLLDRFQAVNRVQLAVFLYLKKLSEGSRWSRG